MESLEITESFYTKMRKRLTILKEKKFFVLGFLLLGLVIALAISFIQPKLFKATSRITFKYDSVNNSVLNKNGSLSNEINEMLSDKNISLVKSSLSTNYNIKNNITATEDIITSSVIVKAIASEAQLSADIANAVVKGFLSNAVIKNRGAYLSILSDINKREKQNADGILRNAKNYQEFLANANIKNLNANDLVLVNKIADLESELEIIEYDNKLNQLIFDKLVAFIEKKFPKIDAEKVLISDNNIDNLRTSFERALTEKIIYNSTKNISIKEINFMWKKSYVNLNSDSLNVLIKSFVEKNIKNNLFENTLDVHLLKNIIWKIEETKIKLNAIDLSKSILYDLITKLEEKFSLIPIRYIEIAQLERTKKFNLKLDKKLKIKEAELRKIAEKDFAEIDSITEADVPTTFYSPNIPNNLFLGALGGLVLGIFLTLFTTKKKLEIITSAEDLEDTSFQVISQIPTIPHGLPLLLNVNKPNIKERGADIIDSFESIEAFLKYGNLGKVLKSVLITSANSDEGKSFVAANIAITIAKTGEKVLLVDANFLNPKLNKLFNMPSSPSLAHYLLKKKELEEIIRRTNIPNLNLVTCVELIQNADTIMKSDRMKEFIKIINDKFDFIIYDSAPFSSLKETVTIAKLVDQTILVTRANNTTVSSLSEITRILKNNGIDNFGVVLNDIES